MNKKSILISLAVLGFSTAASAQSFNPRVEVTNAYQSRSVEGSKNVVGMSVPDSLTVFDYDFDYSVFDNPYKGSYEFKPYLIDMRPAAASQDVRQFYLRAGAGYSLHPEFTAVYSPKLKVQGISLQIYDDFRGYLGNYRTLKGYHMSSLEKYLVDNYENGTYFGFDMNNVAGAKVRYVGDKSVFSLEATYRFMTVKDTVDRIISPNDGSWGHIYNEGGIALNIASKPFNDDKFTYDVDIRGRMGENDIVFNAMGFAVGNTELNGKVDLGMKLSDYSSIGLDFGTDMGFYNRLLSSYAMNVYVTPKFKWTNGRFNADLGAQIAYVFGKDNTNHTISPMHKTESQIIYPAINLSYRILDQGLTLYARATGGNDINQFSTLIEKNHFLNPVFLLSNTTIPIMDNSVTKIDAALGFKGQLAGFLQFDVYGGFADTDAFLIDGMYQTIRTNPVTLVGSIDYLGMKRIFADANLQWLSDHIEAGGHFRYTRATPKGTNDFYLAIPELVADGYITYNWSKRIYLGVNAEYCSERSTLYVIPSYVDLGAMAEFRVNNKLSLWLHGGNLLNRAIQRTPLHAEAGLNVTGGITLNL